jgi:hypothetical protein
VQQWATAPKIFIKAQGLENIMQSTHTLYGTSSSSQDLTRLLAASDNTSPGQHTQQLWTEVIIGMPDQKKATLATQLIQAKDTCASHQDYLIAISIELLIRYELFTSQHSASKNDREAITKLLLDPYFNSAHAAGLRCYLADETHRLRNLHSIQSCAAINQPLPQIEISSISLPPEARAILAKNPINIPELQQHFPDDISLAYQPLPPAEKGCLTEIVRGEILPFFIEDNLNSTSFALKDIFLRGTKSYAFTEMLIAVLADNWQELSVTEKKMTFHLTTLGITNFHLSSTTLQHMSNKLAGFSDVALYITPLFDAIKAAASNHGYLIHCLAHYFNDEQLLNLFENILEETYELKSHKDIGPNTSRALTTLAKIIFNKDLKLCPFLLNETSSTTSTWLHLTNMLWPYYPENAKTTSLMLITARASEKPKDVFKLLCGLEDSKGLLAEKTFFHALILKTLEVMIKVDPTFSAYDNYEIFLSAKTLCVQIGFNPPLDSEERGTASTLLATLVTMAGQRNIWSNSFICQFDFSLMVNNFIHSHWLHLNSKCQDKIITAIQAGLNSPCCTNEFKKFTAVIILTLPQEAIREKNALQDTLLQATANNEYKDIEVFVACTPGQDLSHDDIDNFFSCHLDGYLLLTALALYKDLDAMADKQLISSKLVEAAKIDISPSAEKIYNHALFQMKSSLPINEKPHHMFRELTNDLKPASQTCAIM